MKNKELTQEEPQEVKAGRPIEWFEARVGEAIYRQPIFPSEKGRPHVALKIRNKHHARLLFELQANNKAPYYDLKEIANVGN